MTPATTPAPFHQQADDVGRYLALEAERERVEAERLEHERLERESHGVVTTRPFANND